MSIELKGQVGLQLPKLAMGANVVESLGNLGESLVSEVMGRYYTLAYNGLLFTASVSAAQALSVNSTTFTGLAVANPSGSGKNLILLDASFSLGAAVAAVSAVRLGYAATITLTLGNALFTAGVASAGVGSVAKVGTSGTLGAVPVTLRGLMGIDWVTGGTPVAAVYAKDDIGGAIIIPPGQMATIDAMVAAVTGVPAITWAELPI